MCVPSCQGGPRPRVAADLVSHHFELLIHSFEVYEDCFAWKDVEGVASNEACIEYSVRFGGAMQLREDLKRAVLGFDRDRMPMVIVVVSFLAIKRDRKGRIKWMIKPSRCSHTASFRVRG